MKKTVVILLIALLYANVNGQVKIEIGPQFNGSMGSDFSSGTGFCIDAKYMVTKSIDIGLSIGFQHLFMASGWQERWYQQWHYNYSNANENLTPIRATFTYYFGDKLVKPYLGIETGVTKFHKIYDYADSSYGTLTDDVVESHFAFALNSGLDFELGKTVAIDLNLKYNGGDLSYVSAKIGLVFTFGRNK